MPALNESQYELIWEHMKNAPEGSLLAPNVSEIMWQNLGSGQDWVRYVSDTVETITHSA